MYKKDFKLFLSLMLWSLVPSIYMLLRLNIVTINNVDINVLGQLEWFDLIDEIIVTTLTVPLYSLLKKEKSSSYKNGIAFLLSFFVYLIFTIIVIFNVQSISRIMSAEFATEYLFLQSIVMLVSYISAFMIILFVLNDDYKVVRLLLVFKIILLFIGDYVLISRLSDIGAAYSEILANSILAITSFMLSYGKKYIRFGYCKLDWLADWAKRGFFSGVQIFLDNFIYAVMICKMVNVVSESGNYWVANNFIWGWLLVPIICLSEIIKKNDLEKLTFKNTWRFVSCIVFLWVVTLPLWKPFLLKTLGCDPKDILYIIYMVLPFYVTYLFSSCIDSWFVSKGLTLFNMINSFVVNIIYYGIVYVMFKLNWFNASITFVVLMFGFGMLVHFVVSICLYKINMKHLSKKTINM